MEVAYSGTKAQRNFFQAGPFMICLPGVTGKAPEFYLRPLYTTCFLLLSFQMPSSCTSSCMDYLPLFAIPPIQIIRTKIYIKALLTSF